jgi:hypothetical protein
MSDAGQWRKRAALLHYLQVVHDGRMRWLNVSSIKWNDLVSLASKSLRKKLELWYLLGISMDAVLAAPTCTRMVTTAFAPLHAPCLLHRSNSISAGRALGSACGRSRLHHQRQRAAGTTRALWRVCSVRHVTMLQAVTLALAKDLRLCPVLPLPAPRQSRLTTSTGRC